MIVAEKHYTFCEQILGNFLRVVNFDNPICWQYRMLQTSKNSFFQSTFFPVGPKRVSLVFL